MNGTILVYEWPKSSGIHVYAHSFRSDICFNIYIKQVSHDEGHL